MMRIFIEEQQLDVYQDFTQQITYAVDDLLNIDSKATSFTKTIVIPGTTTNNTLLGNIFEFGNSNFSEGGANIFYNFNASVSAKARIEVNGLQIMKGVLRLMKIIHDKGTVEYEIALFGELGGFVTALGNKRLEDIDFSKYNHNWNITNILESWNPNIILDHASGYTFVSSNKSVTLTGYNANRLKAGDLVAIAGTTSNNTQKTINRVSVSIFRGTPLSNIYFNEEVIAESGNGITLTKLNAGLGIGYVYPLINYGVVSYDIPAGSPSTAYRYKDWQFQAFRPAIFVREYIDKIITDAGYKWQSSFFNTNFFKRLIIPNNDKDLQRAGENYLIDADGSGTISTTLTYTQVSGGFERKSVFNPIKFSDNNTLIDFTYNSVDGKYTYTPESSRSIIVTIFLNGFMNVTGASNLTRLETKLEMYVNSNKLSEYILSDTNITGNTLNYSAKLETELQINKNDVISFRYFLTDAQSGISVTYATTIQSAILYVEPNPKSFVTYLYNQLINFNNVIPRNIQQRDFFTSIMKMFNLMITEDKYQEKLLKIEPDITFYLTDRTTYLDWTKKLDRSQPITIIPMSEANARYYEFKYKDDNDYRNESYKKKFNETYGNRIFDNQLEFAKDTQKVEVIFSPTVLEGAQNEVKVWSAMYKSTNDQEERASHNIRILQCKLIKNVEAYKILNGSTNLVDSSGITEYMYAGHFNDPDFPTSDLNWGAVKELQFALAAGSLQNNLFNGFYSPYMAEITDKDSRLVQCTMKLTDIDIFNLDWRRYIYIDGILYRLKKIIDWTDDNTCKVELLRVINTTYLSDAITFDTAGIGNQIWATDNLNTLYYNNGDAIPIAYSEQEWIDYNNASEGCCAFYKYDFIDGQYGIDSGYGLYYNQFAIADPRGICPAGWRLPTRQDFIDLDTETDGNALKQKGVITWAAGNTGTNSTGWNAFGLGWIDGTDGTPREETTNARYWTSTAFNTNNTYFMELGYATSVIKTGDYARNYNGFNVRLIKI